MNTADQIARLALKDVRTVDSVIDVDDSVQEAAFAARIRPVVEAGQALKTLAEACIYCGRDESIAFDDALAHALRETGADSDYIERLRRQGPTPEEFRKQYEIDPSMCGPPSEPQAEPSGAEDLYDSDTSDPCGKDGAR